jgi:carbon storage regulator
MLILSRKLGQSFHVGEDVRITVVKIDNQTIRIGVEAPDEVSIQRSEIAFDQPMPAARPSSRA